MRIRVQLNESTPGEPLTSSSEVEDAIYEWESDAFDDYPEGQGAKDIPDLLRRFSGVMLVGTHTHPDGHSVYTFVMQSSPRNRYVIDDGTVRDADRWVREEDAESWFPAQDFNKEFWEFPGTMYHATPRRNVPSIQRMGLRASNQTRGLTNRGVGDAVFVHADPEAIDSYGDAVFEVDFAAMKRDGLRPPVSMEPSADEGQWQSALAHKIGLEDFYIDDGGDPGGADDRTVIVHGNIPAKYLRLMD